MAACVETLSIPDYPLNDPFTTWVRGGRRGQMMNEWKFWLRFVNRDTRISVKSMVQTQDVVDMSWICCGQEPS
jgi:hypothetical protein